MESLALIEPLLPGLKDRVSFIYPLYCHCTCNDNSYSRKVKRSNALGDYR